MFFLLVVTHIIFYFIQNMVVGNNIIALADQLKYNHHWLASVKKVAGNSFVVSSENLCCACGCVCECVWVWVYVPVFSWGKTFVKNPGGICVKEWTADRLSPCARNKLFSIFFYTFFFHTRVRLLRKLSHSAVHLAITHPGEKNYQLYRRF